MKSYNVIQNPEASLDEKLRQLESSLGNTPLREIRTLLPNKKVRLFAKLEWKQLGGSVKSRPAFRIIKDAIERGELSPEKEILDASSGNTGIAYAHIGSRLGIPVTLCLPENASAERKQILEDLGARLVLTSKEGSTDEAQEIAREMYRKEPDRYYYADQYNNSSNWKAHYTTTGPEIIRQTGRNVTHFVAGLGTTGTFTGTGRYLKEFNPDIRLVALQPDFPLHGLEGWKHLETALVPGIYDSTLAGEVRPVSTERAYELVKIAKEKEQLLLSPSSAANLAGALELAGELDDGVVVTVFPDDGSKYSEILNQLLK
jgi:S-sulfo-L-cysteine synthase (O-acetyl-L-serine-dependent)